MKDTTLDNPTSPALNPATYASFYEPIRAILRHQATDGSGGLRLHWSADKDAAASPPEYPSIFPTAAAGATDQQPELSVVLDPGRVRFFALLGKETILGVEQLGRVDVDRMPERQRRHSEYGTPKGARGRGASTTGAAAAAERWTPGRWFFWLRTPPTSAPDAGPAAAAARRLSALVDEPPHFDAAGARQEAKRRCAGHPVTIGPLPGTEESTSPWCKTLKSPCSHRRSLRLFSGFARERGN